MSTLLYILKENCDESIKSINFIALVLILNLYIDSIDTHIDMPTPTYWSCSMKNTNKSDYTYTIHEQASFENNKLKTTHF